MFFPFTCTTPDDINASASLREQIPALAMYLFKRMVPSSASFSCFDEVEGLDEYTFFVYGFFSYAFFLKSLPLLLSKDGFGLPYSRSDSSRSYGFDTLEGVFEKFVRLEKGFLPKVFGLSSLLSLNAGFSVSLSLLPLKPVFSALSSPLLLKGGLSAPSSE